MKDSCIGLLIGIVLQLILMSITIKRHVDMNKERTDKKCWYTNYTILFCIVVLCLLTGTFAYQFFSSSCNVERVTKMTGGGEFDTQSLYSEEDDMIHDLISNDSYGWTSNDY